MGRRYSAGQCKHRSVVVEQMAQLWSFDVLEALDPDRAAVLRETPPWNEIVRAVRTALHRSLQTQTAKFGLEASSRDDRDLRGLVQFPIGVDLYDLFFNGVDGYRAQFRIGCDVGLVANAQLVCELRDELRSLGAIDVPLHRLTRDFELLRTEREPIALIESTLDPTLAKVW